MSRAIASIARAGPTVALAGSIMNANSSSKFLSLPTRASFAGILLLALSSAACASRATKPSVPPLSVAEHEITAADLEKAAQASEQKYDPDANLASLCHGSALHARESGEVCWTSVTNPTEEFLKHAAAHRRLATAHRAAAQSLRDAESRACSGVAPDDRDESPFDHREDILRIEPLLSAFSTVPWTEGVVVTFRAVPGMTTEWLQTLMDCQIARNAALGNDVPEMQHCLLVPRGVHAHVTKTREGFAVAIRAADEATANEILRRADGLMMAARRPTR
jgi:hypothetical protein